MLGTIYGLANMDRNRSREQSALAQWLYGLDNDLLGGKSRGGVWFYSKGGAARYAGYGEYGMPSSMTDFGEMSGLFKGDFAPEPVSKLMNAAKYFIGKMKDRSPDIDDIIVVAEAINKSIGYANKGVGLGKSMDKLLVKPQNQELRLGNRDSVDVVRIPEGHNPEKVRVSTKTGWNEGDSIFTYTGGRTERKSK